MPNLSGDYFLFMSPEEFECNVLGISAEIILENNPRLMTLNTTSGGQAIAGVSSAFGDGAEAGQYSGDLEYIGDNWVLTLSGTTPLCVKVFGIEQCEDIQETLQFYYNSDFGEFSSTTAQWSIPSDLPTMGCEVPLFFVDVSMAP